VGGVTSRVLGLAGRRLLWLLAALGLLGIPAVVLRALCVGNSCNDGRTAEVAVPFCPLPPAVRALITAGFRDGRSPDVMATTAGDTVATELHGLTVPWPDNTPTPDVAVPIAFFGGGVTPGRLPAATGLDQIAPTLAAIVQLDRGHPEVRAGQVISQVAMPPSAGAAPRLIVEVVWDGIGTTDLHGAWPPGTAALIRDGAATLRGETGSLPLDPAAVLTTIGTGGLPFQHGITGTILRSGARGVVPAWSDGAPPAVITTLAEDLDHAREEVARVGLVASSPTDRGLIGEGWYVGSDRDDVVVAPADPVAATRRMLLAGFGADAVPDVLGVVLRGSVAQMDRRTEGLVRAARAREPGATFVVTATGSLATPSGPGSPISGVDLARLVDERVGSAVVEAPGAGGLFLDPAALSAAGLSADAAVQAMRAQRTGPEGVPLFAEVYPSFSVAFARYC
jgi:hypothetical protein